MPAAPIDMKQMQARFKNLATVKQEQSEPETMGNDIVGFGTTDNKDKTYQQAYDSDPKWIAYLLGRSGNVGFEQERFLSYVRYRIGQEEVQLNIPSETKTEAVPKKTPPQPPKARQPSSSKPYVRPQDDEFQQMEASSDHDQEPGYTMIMSARIRRLEAVVDGLITTTDTMVHRMTNMEEVLTQIHEKIMG